MSLKNQHVVILNPQGSGKMKRALYLAALLSGSFVFSACGDAALPDAPSTSSQSAALLADEAQVYTRPSVIWLSDEKPSKTASVRFMRNTAADGPVNVSVFSPQPDGLNLSLNKPVIQDQLDTSVVLTVSKGTAMPGYYDPIVNSYDTLSNRSSYSFFLVHVTSSTTRMIASPSFVTLTEARPYADVTLRVQRDSGPDGRVLLANDAETDPMLRTSLGKTFLSDTRDWATVRLTRLASTPGTYMAYMDGYDVVTNAPLRAEIPVYIQ